MRKFCPHIFLIWLISLSTSAYAYFDFMERAKFHGYDGEGSFVEGPAYVGSCFGYVLGLFPSVTITEPQRLCGYDQASDRLGVSILSCCSKPPGAFFGFFPYLLKKGFWDFPKWVIMGSDKSKDYYEYKPVAAPETKIDPRLLVEEKHADLNAQTEMNNKPALVEVPEAHKKIEAPPTPILPTMKEVKTITEKPANTEQMPLPEEKTTLQPISSSVSTDTSGVSGGYSVDTEKIEDRPQKWESSGLPDWVKKQVSQ